MEKVLHLTSGDCAGGSLAKSGVPGEVFVWHDILYDGPRRPGWPDARQLAARAKFIEVATGGGLRRQEVLPTFENQYRRLADAAAHERVVLWFDACLFDQSMLAHILACLPAAARTKTELLVVDAFPGIELYNGLGQLQPEQLASLYGQKCPVTPEQFAFAARVDQAFANQDRQELERLAQMPAAPLPAVPAAAARWLQEWPDPADGLGRMERLALAAVRSGCRTPRQVFAAVAAGDTPPQFWGDTTLWAKLNGLSERRPPLVRIEGPTPFLPQWEATPERLAEFSLLPV